MFRQLISILTFTVLMVNTAKSQSENPQWMRYPAISPDGQTIVFSYKGDLFKVPATGGTAVPITHHTAYEFMPVWSPDGRSIAFASDRHGNFDVFLISAEGGKAKRLTDFSGREMPNSFTPDGTKVLYTASIQDNADNQLFPSGVLHELYAVSIDGGMPEQVLSIPAEDVQISRDGNIILFHDRKGYENPWRKHHTSSIARDVWMYNKSENHYTKLTGFEGEDRNPVFSNDESKMFYLSEQSGSFNVWEMPLAGQLAYKKQITEFDKHPVRFLTIGAKNRLCFSYHGEIFIRDETSEPVKVSIRVLVDDKENPVTFEKKGDGAGEMAVSPDGKEIAFILRGDVFVTSTDFATTRNITQSPEQERSVSFSPDGRKLLYAGERNGSWNIFETTIVRDEDPNFSRATLLQENEIVATGLEEFQPAYSPDGKEVAYLENREALKVINLATGATRTVLDTKYNYSYADGDQWYQWSPDGLWFLVNFSPNSAFMNDVGLVKADGSSEVINLTMSGYNDNQPKWMMDGNMMIWFTDRQGFRSHGSWGAHYDVYALFFNKEAWDKFKLTEEEKKLLEGDKADEKEKNVKEDDRDDKKGKKQEDEKKKVDPIKMDLDEIEYRMARLTIHSSALSDALITPDGKKLYYLSKFEKGYDLWMKDLVKNETKLVLKLEGGGGSLQMDEKGKFLYMISGGKFVKVKTEDNKKEMITYQAEQFLDLPGEREYMFEHVWRQVREKFYDPGIHGVDWDFYKAEYAQKLPYINNNYDFAEMLSEMLGELNASHTGSGYRHSDKSGDRTAGLGILLDWDFAGNGIRIAEVLKRGPFDNSSSKVKAGHIIEKINGETITRDKSFFGMLNHLANKPTLISLYDPASGERWDETIKPIAAGAQNELLYRRWVESRRQLVEEFSGGRLGYVHIRGMDSQSFREVYSEMLGRNHEKEAIIVDTRFNGGGWLHNDLAILLGGKKYVELWPRGEHYGHDPMNQWIKPSVVVMSESNYSDAHFFPYTYVTLGIGNMVGMPVPGTATAVWWETLLDPTLVFGIPQVGTKDADGNYLENLQLEPGIRQPLDYDQVVAGRDQQIEAAVGYMMGIIDRD
jgi:tricorn protease